MTDIIIPSSGIYLVYKSHERRWKMDRTRREENTWYIARPIEGEFPEVHLDLTTERTTIGRKNPQDLATALIKRHQRIPAEYRQQLFDPERIVLCYQIPYRSDLRTSRMWITKETLEDLTYVEIERFEKQLTDQRIEVLRS